MPELPPRLRIAADHLDAGRYDQARAGLQRHLASHPDDSVAHAIMGAVQTRLGDYARAVFHLERARAIDAGNPDLLANLGNARLSSDDAEGAMATYREALNLNPRHLSATIGLVNALNARQRLDEADVEGTAALALWPDDAEVLINRAETLLGLGDAAEAVALLRRATERHPEHLIAASALALTMNYPSGLEAGAVAAAHRRYGTLLTKKTGRGGQHSRKPNDPDRKLRIGIVSPDLRSHSVAYFVEAWLEHRDRAGAELTCYSTSIAEDSTTARLRGHADRWRTVPYLDAAALAAAIRADQIDILIELSGHTSGHRLPTLELRPAPVQVSWLGYPNTTGLSTIGHRIIDSITDPPGTDSHATERLIRLDPCFVCFRPESPLPPISERAEGPATFGSFNALSKLSAQAVSLCAEVVRGCPGSRLVLKNEGLGHANARARTQARFEAAGLTRDRVELLGPQASRAEHLALYGRIDVALDPSPYNGTTTTCEALVMGVPVVTLRGDRHASRVGASLLAAAGHPEWIAQDHASYSSIASGLIGRGPRDAESRKRIRAEMLISALCDGLGFSRRFDSALRGLWQSACRGTTGGGA